MSLAMKRLVPLVTVLVVVAGAQAQTGPATAPTPAAEATSAQAATTPASTESSPATTPATMAVPQAPADASAATTGAPLVLPAMNFVSSLARDELFGLIKTHATFGNLDKELFGSPIMLRISHSLQPTAAGMATGLLSAIWSGGTLGLLPAVTNNNLVVSYEVRVQGKDIATYTYQRTFTRAVNIWAKDETYGLGKDGLEWLKSTVGEFTIAAYGDPKLAALKKEYERYFGAL